MSGVPSELRERCRAALLAGMKGVYRDKDEDYLRSLVARFEQEKLFDVFKELPAYLANANAKLQQVDKTAAPLTLAPPPAPAAAATVPAAAPLPASPPQAYWKQREQLAAKYLHVLQAAVAQVRRVQAALPERHQATAAAVVSHSEKMVAVLETRANPEVPLARLESNCQKCINAARQCVVEAQKSAQAAEPPPAAVPGSPRLRPAAPAPAPAPAPAQRQAPQQQAMQKLQQQQQQQQPAQAQARQSMSKEGTRAALAAVPREVLLEIHVTIIKRLKLEFVAEDPFV